MKHVLLATTALALSAGVAAADYSTSASAKLSYGNYGTGTAAGAAEQAWGQNADFNISMSGEDAGISYSAGLEIGEGGNPSAGPINISGGGLSVTYDLNGIGGLTSTGADGESDNTGDLKVAYSLGGISASYEYDVGMQDTDIHVGYTSGGLTLGLQVEDNDGAKAGKSVMTGSVAVEMGDLTLNVSANDKSTMQYDASVAYAMTAGTTITVGTDEISSSYGKITTSLSGLDLTARFETDGTSAGDTAETEVSLGYTLGDTTLTYAYDTGQKGKFGDEAQSTVVVDHTVGGIAAQLKANDQSEMEASVSFTF